MFPWSLVNLDKFGDVALNAVALSDVLVIPNHLYCVLCVRKFVVDSSLLTY